MFSELCPICGKVLELRPLIYNSLYECKDNSDHYYQLIFSSTDLLLREYLSIREPYNISINNYFIKKECLVTFYGNGFSREEIILPCYIGPNQLDKVKTKVKNYAVMV